MQGTPTTFWGKLAFEGGEGRWHPLASHCADVAACCERLLEVTLLRRRLAGWGGRDDLDGSQVARLSVLAAFHDLGKFNYGFQNKAQERPAFEHGHVKEVLALFGDAYPALQQRLLQVLPVAELERWAPNDGALQLLVAAIGHHGRPGSISSMGLHPKAWASGPWGDPFDAISRLHEATRRWFPAAYAPEGSTLPSTPAFQHGFAGLVMLADWLGSDTAFFPYSEEGEQDRMPQSRAHAAIAARAIGLEASHYRRGLGPSMPSFAAISPFDPRPAQSVTLELPIAHRGSLTILEGETGSGKTEAALARFMRLFHAGLVDGLYFALPTRTAATQLHRRVYEAVERAFPTPDRPPVVLAVPGYLRVDDHEGRRLPGFEVLWNDDANERQRHRGWAGEHPKRYLAGAVVVGTIDQVLLSTLMVPHAHMRATCAARHLLVIDEVHASDDYMVALLEAVLRFHLEGGGHAFLMSATLGASARGRLLGTAAPRPALPRLEDAVGEAYPLLSHVADGGSPLLHGIENVGADKVVQPQVRAAAGHPEAVATAALDAARAGACILVVRNLVRDCVATQRALEAAAAATGLESLLFSVGPTIAPHHSRYACEDRRRLDAAVESSFGKQRRSGLGLVLVATQTVEQSLAHAGMDHWHGSQLDPRIWLPRVRGDGPASYARSARASTASPRTRGTPTSRAPHRLPEPRHPLAPGTSPAARAETSPRSRHPTGCPSRDIPSLQAPHRLPEPRHPTPRATHRLPEPRCPHAPSTLPPGCPHQTAFPRSPGPRRSFSSLDARPERAMYRHVLPVWRARAVCNKTKRHLAFA